MKLGDGVEQAIHCVAVLAGLPAGAVLAAAALAEFHGVSPSYLVKHLQALSGAGIVAALPGPAGGYRLARPAERITLLDVVLAVEGDEPAFRCAEIRQRGPHPLPRPKRPCEIHAAMRRAEQAYRKELAAVTIGDLGAEVERHDPEGRVAARRSKFLDARARPATTKE